ncbi:hypothetical protein HHK36_014016 [Tetracentron sinense]|uniref:Trichohyalin n=1 Tax=Tetracentron sinense TaxID=13715 RepID=A0A834ZBH5_TETSI|nr:hypothetical protein HHK36_014016 [Tetracentron sinense]
MAAGFKFTEEDMVIDEALGFPKAYAKLCRDPHLNPYSHGPPFTFIPYILQPQESLRAKDLDQMFPIIDPEAKPSTKSKIFTTLLWKQLNHLGNAGFDPAKFRVDPYGNVLYYHADSASPLAWEIDHWFPCSRGGRTVPSNLRLLQWQVCKKKQSKLEFLVPWWDLQLGISVNQFLSIFATLNYDFRNRAFSLLFSEGENEELNSSQTVESHAFPKHFIETRQQVGLAPAAIVLSRRESYDASSALKSLDLNTRLRPNSPSTASRGFLVDDSESHCKSIHRFRPSLSKENENPDMITNPYLTIAMARDSLKQREAEKMQAEIQRVEHELDEMKHKNANEKLSLQDLELVLIKHKRRAEKCKRLAEAQSSYRALLEKMIRDSMHQSVVYKEQLRLNQAATSALVARLEAQKAICDSSEKELHKKFKQRDEIEKQIRPEWDQARKRSRVDNNPFEEREDKTVLYLPGIKPRKPSQKELRVFLEEEQKASEAGLSLSEERKQEEMEDKKLEEHNKPLVVEDETTIIEDKLRKLEMEEAMKRENIQFSHPQSREREDEDFRKRRGKGNVEKWLQMLLDNTQEDLSMDSAPQSTKDHETTRTDEIIRKLNLKNPQKEIKILNFPESEDKVGAKHVQEIKPEIVQEGDGDKRKIVEMEDSRILSEKRFGSSKSFGRKEERRERNGKEKGLVRCESARAFRPIPYSPSVILGMRKGVDCIGKKPMVIGDDEDGNEDRVATNNFIKSSIKTIKKAVKF